MFEDNVLESPPHALEEVESPPSVPAGHRTPNAKPSSQEVEAPAPLPPTDPGEWTDWRPTQPEKERPHATGKKPRTGLLKRRPVVYAIGAMLLAAAVG